MGVFFKLARRALTRPSMYRFSRKLHLLGLHGMGILNWESPEHTGEAHFLATDLPAIVGDRRAVVFDVGANVGTYAKRVVAALPDVRVLAFEPHPLTFERLEADAPSNVRCFNMGLGSAPGELTLYDYAASDGSSHASLYKDVIEDIHGAESCSHVVPVRTVDDMVEEHGIERISLLKIDAEGHELEILKGAAGTIERGRVDIVHFEFNVMNAVSGSHFRDFAELLSGYRLYRMLPYGLMLLPKYDPVRCEIYAYQNIVAVRSGVEV